MARKRGDASSRARPATRVRAHLAARRRAEAPSAPAALSVLIATHGPLAGPDRAVSGVALRAEALGQGLARAGLQVGYLIPAENLPHGDEPYRYIPYGRPEDAASLIEASGAKVVVLCHWELLESLPEELPAAVVVDLYAPRLLEVRYQGGDFDRELARSLTALSRADRFLCTSDRLRHYWLGFLSTAGVDLRDDVLFTIPLGLVGPRAPHETYPKDPVFVMGGVFWPWNDHSRSLGTVLASLNRKRHGRLEVYGGRYPIRVGEDAFPDPTESLPRGPRLQTFPMVPYSDLLQAYRRASVAVDVSPATAERELSFSFRSLDYLSSGLPVIATAGTSLGDLVEGNGLGWTVDPDDPKALASLVDSLLARPGQIPRLGKRAWEFARDRFHPEASAAPLVSFCQSPERRNRGVSVLTSLARAASQSFLDRGRRLTELEELRKTREILAEKENDRVAALRRCDELGWELARARQEGVVLENRASALQEAGGQKSRAIEEARVQIAERDAHRVKVETDLAAAREQAERAREERDEARRRLAEAKAETARASSRSGELKETLENLRKQIESLEAVQAREREAWAASLQESRSEATLSAGRASMELEKLGAVVEREREKADRLAGELAEAQEARETLRREAAWQKDEIGRKSQEVERAQAAERREREEAQRLADEVHQAQEKAEALRREGAWLQDEGKRRAEDLERRQQETERARLEVSQVGAELERARASQGNERARAERLQAELSQALDRGEELRREAARLRGESERAARAAAAELEARDRAEGEAEARRAEAEARLARELEEAAKIGAALQAEGLKVARMDEQLSGALERIRVLQEENRAQGEEMVRQREAFRRERERWELAVQTITRQKDRALTDQAAAAEDLLHASAAADREHERAQGLERSLRELAASHAETEAQAARMHDEISAAAERSARERESWERAVREADGQRNRALETAEEARREAEALRAQADQERAGRVAIEGDFRRALLEIERLQKDALRATQEIQALRRENRGLRDESAVTPPGLPGEPAAQEARKSE